MIAWQVVAKYKGRPASPAATIAGQCPWYLANTVKAATPQQAPQYLATLLSQGTQPIEKSTAIVPARTTKSRAKHPYVLTVPRHLRQNKLEINICEKCDYQTWHIKDFKEHQLECTAPEKPKPGQPPADKVLLTAAAAAATALTVAAADPTAAVALIVETSCWMLCNGSLSFAMHDELSIVLTGAALC